MAVQDSFVRVGVARSLPLRVHPMTRRGGLPSAYETLNHREDPDDQRAAAIAVAGRSEDAADAAELLAMLGLLGPPDSPTDVQGGPADLALGELRQRRSQGISGPGGGRR